MRRRCFSRGLVFCRGNGTLNGPNRRIGASLVKVRGVATCHTLKSLNLVAKRFAFEVSLIEAALQFIHALLHLGHARLKFA